MSSPLRTIVGVAAVVAPALHALSDALEWAQGGFSTGQLWLNYVAFVPMPCLLLGLCAVHEPRPRAPALLGALAYGAAFVYFAHTTLVALEERVADYETLWERLGPVYTVHGGLMVVGGLAFAASALRGGWLPRLPTALFAVGLALNLLLWLLPAPELLQTLGSTVRNAGLIALGLATLRGARRP